MKENNYVKDDDYDDDGTQRIIKIMKIYRITKLTEGSKRKKKVRMRKRKKGVRRKKFSFILRIYTPQTSKRKSSRIFAPADTCTKRSGNMRKKAKLFLFSFSSSSSS
ncbi:hypothetical protein ACKWTF_006298 [Chironomus riparius]